MCGRPGKQAWSAWRTQIRGFRHRLGPGNTNVAVSGWVLPLPGTHPVYHPSHTHPARTPGTTQHAHRGRRGRAGHPRTCTYDRFGVPVGDPRVEYAQCTGGRAIPPPATLSRAPHCPCSRLCRPVFSHISVYLSISQYFSVICPNSAKSQLYLSYISVISKIRRARLQGACPAR